MSDSIERSIRTVEFSLRMEGFSVADAYKQAAGRQEYLTQVISGEGKA